MNPRKQRLSQLTEKAFHRATHLVWPYQWQRWWRLVLITFFCGNLGQFSMHLGGSTPGVSPSQQMLYTAQQDVIIYGDYEWLETVADIFGDNLIEISIIAFILSIIYLSYLWLSCHFHFALLHCCDQEKVEIKEPFKRYKKQARSYFFWRSFVNFSIIFWFVLSAFGLYHAVDKLYQKSPSLFIDEFLSLHMTTLISGSLVWLLLSLLITSLSLFVFYVINNYVLPLMYYRKQSFLTAFITAIGILWAFKSDAFKYLLWRIFMSIAVMFMVSFGAIACFIIGVLFLGALGGMVWLTILLFPILSSILIITAPIAIFIITILFSISLFMLFTFAKLFMRTLCLYYLDALPIEVSFCQERPSAEPASKAPPICF